MSEIKTNEDNPRESQPEQQYTQTQYPQNQYPQTHYPQTQYPPGASEQPTYSQNEPAYQPRFPPQPPHNYERREQYAPWVRTDLVYNDFYYDPYRYHSIIALMM